MSQQNPEKSIRELADVAKESICQQQENGAAMASARPKPSSAKKVFTLMLLLAFACTLLIQYPNFHEPFGRPDPKQDSVVAEADLTVIATLIQSYQIGQGKYPATLDEVRLPEVLVSFIAEQKITYRLTEKAYVLEWHLSGKHLVFDGETGKVALLPVAAAKSS